MNGATDTGAPSFALTAPKRQDELRSFNVFFHAAAPLFASHGLDEVFWQKLLPASAQYIPFAWDASIAIGHLFEYQLRHPQQEWPGKIQLAPAYIQSLKFYSRAVARSKTGFARGDNRNLLALLSSLVFAAYEFQQGSALRAGVLLEHSQSLFELCVSPQALAETPTSSTAALEEALIPFLSRHTLSLALLGLPHSLRLFNEPLVPSEYANALPPALPGQLDIGACRREFHDLTCRTRIVIQSARLVNHRHRDIVRVKRIEALITDLDHWHVRFTQLIADNDKLSNGISSLDTHEIMLNTYMRAHFHVARIEASTCHSDQETIYDGFFDDFRAILNQANVLGRIADPMHLASYPPFAFGIGPPLYYVATRCRHPTLRRHGLTLLKAVPRPTPPTHWSRLPIAQIAEAIIVFEEESEAYSTQERTPESMSTDLNTDTTPSPPLPSELLLPPEHRRIHHTQLITRPRPGGTGGARELALRFTTYLTAQVPSPAPHPGGLVDDADERSSQGSGGDAAARQQQPTRIAQTFQWALPPHIAVGLG